VTAIRGAALGLAFLAWLPSTAAASALLTQTSPQNLNEPSCPSPTVRLSTRAMDVFLRTVLAVLEERKVAPPPLPVVLFLPGGPGSRLIRESDGKVIFGKNRVDAAEIALIDADSLKVKVELLKTYDVYGIHQDIYGEIEKALKAAIDGNGNYKPWPYDWRLDAGTLAQRLGDDLKKTYAGREIFILAHSHGGVVAWKWQEQYDPKNDPFTVDHMVLLGSPIRGSCEFARLLTTGWRTPPGVPSDLLAKLLNKWLMGDIRPAAFTMPGTFLILTPQPPTGWPDGRLDAGCLDQVQLFPNKDPEASILNPHSLTFWQTPLGEEFVDKAWDKLKIPKTQFWDLLRDAIDAGNKYRPDLSKRNIHHMRYFYSMDYPTTRKQRLVLDEHGRLATDSQVEDAAMGDENPLTLTELGDGRVLGMTPREPRVCTEPHPELCAECANATPKNPVCCMGPLEDVCVDRVTLTHGSLPAAHDFLEYVEKVLGPTVTAMRVRSLARDLRQRLESLPLRQRLSEVDWKALVNEVSATKTNPDTVRALQVAIFGPQ
jgi:hypothetical protein